MPKRSLKKNHLHFDDAYVVTVDMGYGHQRAVYPLEPLAACPPGIDVHETNIVTANTYPGIPAKDRSAWEGGRKIYEWVSRMKKLPLVGKHIFGIMDHMQRIEPFYPRRDLSRPTAQVKQQIALVKRGWGKDLIDRLNKDPKPMITSFFSISFFADHHGYKGDIYCLCTDTDIARAWVPLDPKKSKINYLAPTVRVRERLKEYGVPEKRIVFTGFPLPAENIGKHDAILKKDVADRICHLDPLGKYQHKYEKTLKQHLGQGYRKHCTKRPLTITFAVGGAGAQRDIGVTIGQSLTPLIRKGKVKLNLVAGVRQDVFRYYEKRLPDICKDKVCQNNVHIIYADTKREYFQQFNQALRTTDILWTKPSELSFYAGLGLPIVMSPPVGAQERFNQAWLHAIGAGFEQEDPTHTDEWLFDWINSGWLAQAAMEGFLDAPRSGTQNIMSVIKTGSCPEEEVMQLL